MLQRNWCLPVVSESSNFVLVSVACFLQADKKMSSPDGVWAQQQSYVVRVRRVPKISRHCPLILMTIFLMQFYRMGCCGFLLVNKFPLFPLTSLWRKWVVGAENGFCLSYTFLISVLLFISHTSSLKCSPELLTSVTSFLNLIWTKHRVHFKS